MSETLIQIRDAGFSHTGTQVFDRVDLTVSKGESLCLLGPNGCGKTTLLDCLLGINTLDKGSIIIDQTPITRMSAAQTARYLAYVPQRHSSSFSFTVMDILLMGRTPYTALFSSPSARDRKKAEALLESLGLLHLKDRNYTRLSGGETQLVMILRALVQDTPVIVMDEPTAHLDFKNELLVLETIARMIRDRGLTLIMATHFPNHAFFLENAGLPVQVCFMHQGRIQTAGTPSQALTGENISRVFGVKAAVVTEQIRDNGEIKQIIPIKTMDGIP
nr:ABC transporter ATP-binding protein [uncultured Desulfobacter sp.]